jgi:hypothetical protein
MSQDGYNLCSAHRTCSACHIASRLSREAMVMLAGGVVECVSEFIDARSNDGMDEYTLANNGSTHAKVH